MSRDVDEGPNSSLVIVGEQRNKGETIIARFTAGGAIDTSFASSGVNALDLTGGEDYYNALEVLADGSMIAAGTASNSGSLSKFNANGSVDTSFNTTGKAVINLGGGAYSPYNEVAVGLVELADGKVVLGFNSDISVVMGFGAIKLTP